MGWRTNQQRRVLAVQRTIRRTPHSNFRAGFPEIETIYRGYQVLLLQGQTSGGMA
jgi:hypothetical protein